MKIRTRRLTLAAVATLGALLLAACASSDDASTASRSETPAVMTSIVHGPAEHGETRDFLSGPAVTVPDGWEEPGDRVARTGAYLPANGLPTLVFVDAIW
ncbi:MAG TPA: hypothetical protein QF624_03935 [Dehalococcoidia bacterium]|nr:hypothetical protein [Dehalococcoidia bacterium]